MLYIVNGLVNLRKGTVYVNDTFTGYFHNKIIDDILLGIGFNSKIKKF